MRDCVLSKKRYTLRPDDLWRKSYDYEVIIPCLILLLQLIVVASQVRVLVVAVVVVTVKIILIATKATHPTQQPRHIPERMLTI